MEETTMKRTRKDHLWYNPAPKKSRTLLDESCLPGRDAGRLAESQEGRSLLESYCRFYTMR